jgi:outer membrane protein OmpA-like peptidoglycan-associated protein
MIKTRTVKFLVVFVAVGAVSGCATKKYVQEELETADQRNAERVELIKAQIEDTQMEVEAQGEEIAELSKTSQEALDRAVAAGKLAEGKLLYEKVLSDDKLRFASDKAELSSEATAELDAFSEELVLRNENVFIEIQGHTDATGSEEYNRKLGEERAEAVLRYLNAQHGIPLHRMSVISYGESAPLVDNSTRDNRAMNRRVTLVVLK